MRIVYEGPFSAVHVPDLGDDRIVPRGVPIEVPDELGARLAEQADWRELGVPRALRPRGSRAGRETEPSTAGGAGEEG